MNHKAEPSETRVGVAKPKIQVSDSKVRVWNAGVEVWYSRVQLWNAKVAVLDSQPQLLKSQAQPAEAKVEVAVLGSKDEQKAWAGCSPCRSPERREIFACHCPPRAFSRREDAVLYVRQEDT